MHSATENPPLLRERRPCQNITGEGGRDLHASTTFVSPVVTYRGGTHYTARHPPPPPGFGQDFLSPHPTTQRSPPPKTDLGVGNHPLGEWGGGGGAGCTCQCVPRGGTRGCRNEKKKLGVSNTPYDGGWWVTDGGWCVTDDGWCVTDGGWWVTDGGWWVAAKHQRVDAIVKKEGGGGGERPYGAPWVETRVTSIRVSNSGPPDQPPSALAAEPCDLALAG